MTEIFRGKFSRDTRNELCGKHCISKVPIQTEKPIKRLSSADAENRKKWQEKQLATCLF
jgi:hypothetical protein